MTAVDALVAAQDHLHELRLAAFDIVTCAMARRSDECDEQDQLDRVRRALIFCTVEPEPSA